MSLHFQESLFGALTALAAGWAALGPMGGRIRRLPATRCCCR